MPLKQGAAGLPHWHTYVIRFWFQNSPDQDKLSHDLQKRYAHLHGSNLNAVLEGKSSDEELAEWFLSDVQAIAVCCKVTVINDFQRGAEAAA
jgi:hypothetical protein